MDTPKESPGQSRTKVWFVFSLFLFLMALAHGVAELHAWMDARGGTGLLGHSALHYRVIYTIWVSIFLLTPALCFHVF